MKKVLCLAVSFVCIFTLVACSSDTEKKSDDQKSIGIIQIVDHKSLNTIREATIKEIKAQNSNVEIIYKNANGDMSTLNTIANQFKADGVDAIVAIATPSAMAAATVSQDIPVIFAAVSDPVGAKLVDSLEKPGANITGTSDEVQVDQILTLAQEMLPETKTVGFLYNSAEANSVSNITKAKVHAQKLGFAIEEVAFASTSDIQSAMQTLCDKSDIVFSPNDNAVASAMDIVTSIANQTNTPFFVGADSMVEDGGLATAGINYEALGKETGIMVTQVLSGTKPSDIPVKVFKDDLNVYINLDVANNLQISLETIKTNYKNVIEIK